MDDLRELVKVIHAQNPQKSDFLLPWETGIETNVELLYKLLAEDDPRPEEELADIFYKRDGNQRLYFNRLKRQLRDKAVNSLLLTPIEKNAENLFARLSYSSLKGYIAVKLLFLLRARRAAIALANHTIRKAQRVSMTDISLLLAKDLRNHYALHERDRKLYEHYDQLADQLGEVLQAELKAEKYYAELQFHLVNVRTADKSVIRKAERYDRELRAYLPHMQSYRLVVHTFLLSILRFEIQNDSRGVIKTCREGLDFFRLHPDLATQTIVFNLQLRIMAAYIHLGNYGEAPLLYDKMLANIKKGSFNWSLTQYIYFLLSLHAGEYQRAYQLYDLAMGHPNFSRMPAQHKEQWYILEAYTHFLIAIGRIQAPKVKALRKFRMGKFLNEVPKFSQDKRGANISILLIQVLFLLQQKRYGEFADRMESLRTYTQRYLRRDDTFRSNCMINMLLQLPKAGFHKAGVIRKAEKYREKLYSVPLREANQNWEIEIIPYETVWEIVLEQLDHNFH